MGLEGTLKVFSLTDIFQMLGLQRKTGVLKVDGEDDTITISFLGGSVVAAESTARRLDNRLGNLLIRAGYVTNEQLERVLVVQRETQQRMGFLLIREGLIDPQAEVVLLNTGDGLKTLDAVAPTSQPTFTISPSYDDFEANYAGATA